MPNSSCSTLINVRTGLQVTARTAGAAKTIEVEVDKPLGLTLGQKSGGGVVITVSLLVIVFYIFVFLVFLLLLMKLT
jgi:hypothetical protein